MVVTGQSWIVYAGNAHEFQFVVTDQDTPGSPVKNITGQGARFALSKFKADGTYGTTPVLTKDSANVGEITITDAVNGELSVFLDEGDTALLGGHDYYVELELYASTSLVIATGTLTINKNVENP